MGMSESFETSVHDFANTFLDYQIYLGRLGQTPEDEILICTPGEGWSLGALEELTEHLRNDQQWYTGIEEQYRKGAGGIGADGPVTLSVALGVTKMVPSVAWLLKQLRRENPPLDDRLSARRRAEAAVLRRYATDRRKDLKLRSEAERIDHWEFSFRAIDGDSYTVEVYGIEGKTSAERIRWESSAP